MESDGDRRATATGLLGKWPSFVNGTYRHSWSYCKHTGDNLVQCPSSVYNFGAGIRKHQRGQRHPDQRCFLSRPHTGADPDGGSTRRCLRAYVTGSFGALWQNSKHPKNSSYSTQSIMHATGLSVTAPFSIQLSFCTCGR